MDIYQKKSNWKIILAVLAAVMLVITLIYSNYLANKLKENEKLLAKLFIDAQQSVAKAKDEANLEFELEVLQNVKVPVILKTPEGELIGNNFDEFEQLETDSLKKTENSELQFLQNKIQEFELAGKKPLILANGYGGEVYYFDSSLYNYIKYFPIVQIGLLSIFVALGYYLFSSARRSEQNRVWAGMAKETAHQLGTPISAIIAWIEMLKTATDAQPDQIEIIDELRNDVTRLELIADRFSKIGSAPKLEVSDLLAELKDCQEYMKKRASRKIKFTSLQEGSGPFNVSINKHLFAWVIENLYRNALDAMPGSGQISTNTYLENEYVCIDIKDSGKGIPVSKFKTVFEPGFSTKTRGWGLGLSLAKRIIENYHNGKIFVKSSKPNEGTTFAIKLPMA